MVSDLGGGNRGLSKELNITTENPWFYNHLQEKIFVFADVPHLIKLIRNHFVDNGFIYKGKEINKSIVEKLMSFSSQKYLSITYKISAESLNVKGAGRQKVKLATKLFSQTVSAAIKWCGDKGYFEDENWAECAEFFKLVTLTPE